MVNSQSVTAIVKPLRLLFKLLVRYYKLCSVRSARDHTYTIGSTSDHTTTVSSVRESTSKVSLARDNIYTVRSASETLLQ